MSSWYKKNFQNTTTDANGAEVEYTYDQAGRITQVLAPKEAEAGRPYTLKFEYDLSGADGTHKGVTSHNTEDDEFTVISYIDSLGRPKYTERPSMLSTDKGIEKKTVRSAYTMVDAFGRKVKSNAAPLLQAGLRSTAMTGSV